MFDSIYGDTFPSAHLVSDLSFVPILNLSDVGHILQISPSFFQKMVLRVQKYFQHDIDTFPNLELSNETDVSSSHVEFLSFVFWRLVRAANVKMTQ